MRDKTIVWITGGGIVFWLLIGHSASRAIVFGAARAVVNNVVSFF